MSKITRREATRLAQNEGIDTYEVRVRRTAEVLGYFDDSEQAEEYASEHEESTGEFTEVFDWATGERL